MKGKLTNRQQNKALTYAQSRKPISLRDRISANVSSITVLWSLFSISLLQSGQVGLDKISMKLKNLFLSIIYIQKKVKNNYYIVKEEQTLPFNVQKKLVF